MKNSKPMELQLVELLHELNSSLTSILCWTQLLKKGMTNSNDFSNGLEAIEKSGLAQKKLIFDFIENF